MATMQSLFGASSLPVSRGSILVIRARNKNTQNKQQKCSTRTMEIKANPTQQQLQMTAEKSLSFSNSVFISSLALIFSLTGKKFVYSCFIHMHMCPHCYYCTTVTIAEKFPKTFPNGLKLLVTTVQFY